MSDNAEGSAMTEIHLIPWTATIPSPPCSRCGSDQTLRTSEDGDSLALTIIVDPEIGTEGGVVVNASNVVCESCITPAENTAQGRRILAWLESEVDRLRLEWLGEEGIAEANRLLDTEDDIHEAFAKIEAQYGKRPTKMGALIDQISEIEELIDDLDYVAGSMEYLYPTTDGGDAK